MYPGPIFSIFKKNKQIMYLSRVIFTITIFKEWLSSEKRVYRNLLHEYNYLQHKIHCNTYYEPMA